MLCAIHVCIYVLITICKWESPFSEADIPSASQKDSVKTERNAQDNTGWDSERHVKSLMSFFKVRIHCTCQNSDTVI
jgi:hypothetical protein